MEESVNGVINTLNANNKMNQTLNYSFEYATTTVINSNTLSSYDVLIMPGGDGYAYVTGNTIDSQAIKQFVSGGKGYLGICAGACSFQLR